MAAAAPPPPSAFEQLLQAQQPCAILDGALGTELEARGVCINNSRLWAARLLCGSAADSEQLRQLHLDYCRAGADVITTATYQVRAPPLLRAWRGPLGCGTHAGR